MEARTVGASRGTRLLIGAGFPALGAVGAAGAAVALEAVSQASTGVDGVLGYGGHLGEPVALVVATILGLVIGAAAAAGMLAERLRVTVSPRALGLSWDDARVTVPREVVSAVVLDGDLVILGPHAVELARVSCDVDKAALRTALTDLGYPGPAPRDPHAAEFRPWQPGTVDAPAERLLDARAHALARRAFGDAELLRRRLAARGLMVRDVRRGRRTAQEWRALAAAGWEAGSPVGA